MTPGFSVKFVIDRLTANYKIQITDTTDYTGVSTAYGFYRIEYPDLFWMENSDPLNPDFQLGQPSSEFIFRLKNSVPTVGQYRIIQKIYADTGDVQTTKTITFSFVEPALSMVFAGNLLIPTVVFEDTTNYVVGFYSESVSKTISCNYPAHLPFSSTEVTSSSDTINMIYSGSYYEGIYAPRLSCVSTYTGTEHIIEWTGFKDFQIDVRRLFSYSELNTIFNNKKEILDSKKGTTDESTLVEQYQLMAALYDHIELKIKNGDTGIEELMMEIQELAYDISCCCSSAYSDGYQYSVDPMTEFNYSEVIESGFNIVADKDGIDQFNSAVIKKIRFEGTGATSVSFDPLTNKVIINSEPAVGDTYITEGDMIIDQSNQVSGSIYYAGDTYYQYLGTTNGDISDYREIMGGMKWVTVDQDVASLPNMGYISNGISSRLVITLPSTGIEYSIRVAGRGSSGWRVLAPAGGKISWIDEDLIKILDSTNQWDAIEFVAVTPGNYVVISSIGNIQFTK